MRFVPTKSDHWYHLPKLSDPDRAEGYFLHNWGEWSENKEKDFEKHLLRYKKLNNFYAHLNGKKIRAILKEENLWYTRSGLEELIY